MMEIQLDEAFDENTKTYPVINLKPNLKLPQVWKFDVPGNESLMARMVSFQSDGDNVKNVKMGDKFVQVFLMSLSDKGNAGELRGGLGSDAIGAITTIFDTVAAQAKQYRFDAVLFRLPIKKMKGQGPIVQRIMARLALQRTGGKFVVLKELWGHSSKYAYVLIRRKNVNLEDIEGIPAISPELFTAVETKAGTTYVDKKSGDTVTKDEAFAATIAAKEDNRSSDRQIAAKTKISRRDAIMAQYGTTRASISWSAEETMKRDWLNATPPVYTAEKEQDENISLIARSSVDHVKGIVERGREEIKSVYEDDNQDNMDSGAYHLRNQILTLTNNFNKSPNMITPRTEVEINGMVKDALVEYYDIIAGFNGKNHMEIFEKLSTVMLSNYSEEEVSKDRRVQFVEYIIKKFNDDVYFDVVKQYMLLANKIKPKKMSKEQRAAIKAYCGSGFGEINRFLTGEKSAGNAISETAIPNLDSAFKDCGITLPKGTPLYRGMSLSNKSLTNVIEKKMFYFTNFVSTSLIPAFVGMYGNSASAFDKSIAREIDFDNDSEVDSKMTYDYRATVGLTINGADKIKVIVPGSISNFQEECEVILPRGTVIRFNKAWVNAETSMNTSNAALITSTVIPLEQLTESTEVYDGDALLNEGVVKLLDFSTFFKENYEEDDVAPPIPIDVESEVQKSRSIIMGNTPGMDILLGMVQPMPEKFEMM